MKRIVLAFVLSLLLFSISSAQYCTYLPGDMNSDGQCLGGDVTYGVRYLKGIGNPPPDSCFNDSVTAQPNHYLYVAADVNGNCEFRGSDITRLVAYFKGLAALQLCRFFPPPQVPVLTTSAVSAITDTTAACGGTITSDGGAAITARGVCWSTDSIPTIVDSKTVDGSGSGSFTSSITGLEGITHYYIRAYATNSAGTGYGNIKSFYTTDSTGTMTDIDGNTYRTVKIGNQWWMAENLKVTHYRNGGSIPNVTDDTEWFNLTTDAYCDYNNDTTNVAIYGRLYNWSAATDSRNIAPAGWHVPTDAEWQQLEMYLGMSQIQAGSSGYRGTDEGGKMKEAGTTHWVLFNTGATNASGFSALPGGERVNYGPYDAMGELAYFWSSSVNGISQPIIRALNRDDSRVFRSGYNPYGWFHGFSVRCVRD